MTTINIDNPIRSEMNKCAAALHQHAHEMTSALAIFNSAMADIANPDWSKIHSAVADIRYHATGMSRDAQTSWALKRAIKLMEGGER